MTSAFFSLTRNWFNYAINSTCWGLFIPVKRDPNSVINYSWIISCDYMWKVGIPPLYSPPKRDEKVKDIINPYNCLLKNANFSIKTQPVTKQHHISLNSQLTAVLKSIFCFSVRFCDNSLLVLKMRFQVFSFERKKVQGFSSDRKILMSL